jgi:hypothetical protein
VSESFVGDIFDDQPNDKEKALPFISLGPVVEVSMVIDLRCHLCKAQKASRAIDGKEQIDRVCIFSLFECFLKLLIAFEGGAPNSKLD